jgi:hypothetical protein
VQPSMRMFLARQDHRQPGGYRVNLLAEEAVSNVHVAGGI